jgi:hypothetical protein
MAILPKAIYMFKRSSLQIPNDIHHRDWKVYPKVHVGTQENANSQGTAEQKEQFWRYHNTWFQTIVQSYSNKNRYEDQWNRIKDTDMNSHSYAHLIFDKVTKNVRCRRQPLQQMLLGKVATCLLKAETRSLPITLYYYQLKVD